MTPAQQMRAAAERLRDEADRFDNGEIWNGAAVDLAVAVLNDLPDEPA